MVFDGSKGNYSEKDKPAPINFYGWSKLSAEHSVARMGKQGVIVRISNLYGRPAIGGSSFSEEVIQTIRKGHPYKLYADQYRSFMSVKNLAECIWEIASNDFGGLLHLGGLEAVNRVSFAHKLADRIDLDRALLKSSCGGVGPQGLPYPRNNTFDLTLAQSVLKTPLLDLDTGLSLEYPF
jgi:dTDP-4-dehydrorhamnose reductase